MLFVILINSDVNFATAVVFVVVIAISDGYWGDIAVVVALVVIQISDRGSW